MLCMKEVKQMQDHLTNEHKIGASSFRHITAYFKLIVEGSLTEEENGTRLILKRLFDFLQTS